MQKLELGEKCLLTLDEAAIYMGLGKQKLREIRNSQKEGKNDRFCRKWNMGKAIAGIKKRRGSAQRKLQNKWQEQTVF